MGDKQFDLSGEELDKIRRRQEIRRHLKAEFNKLHYNPLRNAYRVQAENPAVHRFMAARALRGKHWQPSWRSFRSYFTWQVFPIVACSLILYRLQRNKEMKFRTGEIPYEQRDHKLAI